MLSKYLSPRNDAAFKRIFNEERNKDILMHFLNDILPLKSAIKRISFLKTVQNAEIAALRESLIDTMCEDENGERFIVEMQVAHERGFDKRSLYYAARAYLSQRGKDVHYKDLKNVYFLAITGFCPFPNKRDWFSHIGLTDLKTHEHDIASIQLFFLQLPLFEKTKEDIKGMSIREKWAYFFKHADETREEELEEIVGKDLVIKKAYDELNRFSWSEQDLLYYESVDMKICSDLAALEAAEERGIEKGRKEEKLIIAMKLLARGMSIEEVSEMTELAIEEAQSLE